MLEYDFDSEAEWEDPADGEELKSDDDEDDDEAVEKFVSFLAHIYRFSLLLRTAKADDDDEDENDGFIVPEGYLSAGEGEDEEVKHPDLIHQSDQYIPRRMARTLNASCQKTPRRVS